MELNPVWRDKLDSLGFMDKKGLNVLVWPAPWNDMRVEAFLEDPRVSSIFFVNGGEMEGRQERTAEIHEKFVSLDNHLDRGLLNHDIPDLVSNGEIPEIDIELARDPAMAVVHNPKLKDVNKRMSGKTDEKTKKKIFQEEHKLFVEIMEKTAATSQKIIGKNGVSIYDTDHFGYNFGASDWKIFMNNPPEKRREIHLEELGKIFSSHFQDIQMTNDPNKQREFFILSNR